MVLTTTLPKDYNETSFAIRSSLQDIQFYVGNSLRAQYSTKDTRMAGKNSALGKVESSCLATSMFVYPVAKWIAKFKSCRLII